MDRIDVLLKAFIATFGGFCGYFLGGWDATLKILVTMAVIDYLTGMIAAGYNGELKSKVGFKGIAKKGGAFSFGRSGRSTRFSTRK